MTALSAFAIGAMVAGFETVVGTLIAVVLVAALLKQQRQDIYDAVALSASGALVVAILYQFIDPVFASVLSYLQAEGAGFAQFLSQFVFPLARFSFIHVIVDLLLAVAIYGIHFHDPRSYTFTVLYTAFKLTLALSVWLLFIAPIFVP